MDQLPFDVLCHVYEYLPLNDLQALVELGALHEEAAHSVARRHCRLYRLALVDHAEKLDLMPTFCQFLAQCVRTLTIEFHPRFVINARSSAILVDLVTSATRLTELTLINSMDNFCPGPAFLANVRRLTLCNVSECDDFVTSLLITARPGCLTELTIEDMRLNGSCLLSLTGQLSKLSVHDVHNFNVDHILGMIAKFPRLQALEIEDTYGGTRVYLPLLVDHLQHLSDLRLYTSELMCLGGLQRLTALRRLYVSVDRIEHELLAFMRSVKPGHPLRHLCLEASNNRFTEPMGRALHNFERLTVLELDVQQHVLGVEALLRGCDGHPALREVRLTGSDGVAVVTPRDVHQSLQYIDSLHLRAHLTCDLLYLAQISRLSELKVRLLVPAESCQQSQLECANHFLRDLSEKNTLRVLHMQACFEDPQPFELHAPTIAALRRFSSLRELKLVGRCPMETVRAVLGVMHGLEVFENAACAADVAKAATELRRLRPQMRRVRFCCYPEEL